MAAPADDGDGSTTTTTAGQDDEAVVKSTKPLPRAIQLVMAIVGSPPTTTTTSAKTIGDLAVRGRPALWIMLVVLPFTFIAAAAGVTFAMLCGPDGSSSLRAVPIPVLWLLFLHMAVLKAAMGHLGLFAPRTPYIAWEAFDYGMWYEVLGFYIMLASVLICALAVLVDQAWPLVVAWTCLLGVLVVSTIALWLCLLRTYGDGGGERRRRENSSSAAADVVIDGLAYLYSRLLYEYAVRIHGAVVSDADQQLDAEVPLLA